MSVRTDAEQKAMEAVVLCRGFSELSNREAMEIWHAAANYARKNPESLAGEAMSELEEARLDLFTCADERDHWIRVFNRLSALIAKHQRKGFIDEADEALHAGYQRVLKDVGPHPAGKR